MRAVVFRRSLTINGGEDPSGLVVERLRAMGHEVLHTTAVCPAGQAVPDPLSRDLIPADHLEELAPQALVLFLAPPDGPLPREAIKRTVQSGGCILYVLGPCPGDEMRDGLTLRWLAERGFFFESMHPSGARPLRRLDGQAMHFSRKALAASGLAPDILHGVHYIDIRHPFVISAMRGPAILLSVAGEECCTVDGLALPPGPWPIAASCTGGGREVLVTGDWYFLPSQASRQCNAQFLANLAMLGWAALPGRPTPASVATNLVAPVAGDRALYVSAAASSAPFTSVLGEHLDRRGLTICSGAGAAGLKELIDAGLSAFVPVIDRTFEPHQEEQTALAIEASRRCPDRLRVVPINLLRDLRPEPATGALRSLAEWVWLPGYDSREWERIFALLVRVVTRPHGRFRWRTTGVGRRTFVSYSFRDHDLVQRVRECLDRCGLDTFVADETTLLNAHLREELRRLVEECEVFFAVITPAYRDSNWSFVEGEIATARFRQGGLPRVVLFAPPGQRVPRWYHGFPVCGELDRLPAALEEQGILDPPRRAFPDRE
jgi:hypothetical protein